MSAGAIRPRPTVLSPRALRLPERSNVRAEPRHSGARQRRRLQRVVNRLNQAQRVAGRDSPRPYLNSSPRNLCRSFQRKAYHWRLGRAKVVPAGHERSRSANCSRSLPTAQSDAEIHSSRSEGAGVIPPSLPVSIESRKRVPLSRRSRPARDREYNPTRLTMATTNTIANEFGIGPSLDPVEKASWGWRPVSL